MVRKYKKKTGTRPYKNFSNDQLAKALHEIKSGRMSQRKASKTYRINRSTLQFHLTHENPLPHGGQTVLSLNEEKMLQDHIVLLANYGFPIDKFDLRHIVANFLNRKGRRTRFHDNMPGSDWVELFLQRHPEISFRFATNLKKQKAELNTTVINEYFDNLKNELEGVPPENIYNFDETNLTDDPGRQRVLVKRGSKYPEKVMHSSKAATSLMFCGNAAGTLLPPYVVYKATHIYDTWREGGPVKTRYNRTKSGWFDSQTFEDWFENLLLPILRKQDGIKVVIGDNLSSHLALHVLDICKANNIKFICLPPNSTHLMQPLDVAFFAPMKKTWRKILRSYKQINNGPISKSDFPKKLKQLLAELLPTAGNNLQSGFRKCGIFPLNKDEVLSRLPKPPQCAEDASGIGEAVLGFLHSSRFGSPGKAKQPARKKKKLEVLPGKSVVNLEDDVVLESDMGTDKTDEYESDETDKSESENKTAETETQNENPAENEDSVVQENMSESENSRYGNGDEQYGEQSSDDGTCPTGFIAKELSIDDFVVVEYEGNYYPGKVENIKTRKGKSVFTISAMERSGRGRWKWPSQKDILDYEEEDIKAILREPFERSSRGIYKISSMEKYEEFVSH